MAAGADLESSSAMFGTNWINSPPKIAPGIEANPPTTTPTSRKIDRMTVKLSGDTILHGDAAQRAGQTPVNAGRDAEGQRS